MQSSSTAQQHQIDISAGRDQSSPALKSILRKNVDSEPAASSRSASSASDVSTTEPDQQQQGQKLGRSFSQLQRKRSNSVSHFDSTFVSEKQHASMRAIRSEETEQPAASVGSASGVDDKTVSLNRTRSLGRQRNAKEKISLGLGAPLTGEHSKYPIMALGVPPPFTVTTTKRNSVVASSSVLSAVNLPPMYDPYIAASERTSATKDASMPSAAALGMSSSGASFSSGSSSEREKRERVVQVKESTSFAAKKLDLDFRKIFPTVADTDRLIEDIPCVLRGKDSSNKEQASRGTLWVSIEHVGFSNAQNVPTFLLAYPDILSFSKRQYALVIPSAIEIECVTGQKYYLSSFLDRDGTMELLNRLHGEFINDDAYQSANSLRVRGYCVCSNAGSCEACRNAQSGDSQHETPMTRVDSLVSSESADISVNGMPSVMLQKAPPQSPRQAAQKHRKTGAGSQSSPESLFSSDLSHRRRVKREEDKARKEEREFEKLRDRDNARKDDQRISKRKAGVTDSRSMSEKNDGDFNEPIALKEKPAVQCGCDYPGMQLIEDKLYPLGFETFKDLVYSRLKNLFGGAFLVKFLHEKRKVSHMFITDWSPPGIEAPLRPAMELLESEEILDLKRVEPGWHRTIEYTLPLAIPLGPPQTKCIIVEEIVKAGDGMLCIRSKTRNPDIFDGFQVIARLCMTHNRAGQTRQVVYANVEFWKFTLIKLPIANGAYGGVKSNCATLASAISDYLARHPNYNQEIASKESDSIHATFHHHSTLSSAERKLSNTGSPVRRRRSEGPPPSPIGGNGLDLLYKKDPPSSITPFLGGNSLMNVVASFVICVVALVLAINTLVLWRLLSTVEVFGRAIVRIGAVVDSMKRDLEK